MGNSLGKRKEITGLQNALPKLRRLLISVLYERSPKNQSNELRTYRSKLQYEGYKCFECSSPILLHEDYNILNVVAKGLSTGQCNRAS